MLQRLSGKQEQMPFQVKAANRAATAEAGPRQFWPTVHFSLYLSLNGGPLATK
jgi:hypothetical protein